MPLAPFPKPADAAHAGEAGTAILMGLVDALVSKGVLANEDVTKILGTAVRDLGAGSGPAQLVGRLMERVAKSA